MDPLQNGLSMLFKKKNKTSVENSIAVVGVTKALLIGKQNSWYRDCELVMMVAIDTDIL